MPTVALAATEPGRAKHGQVEFSVADKALLPHRLVADRPSSAEDESLLQELLAKDQHLAVPDRLAALERFLANHPDSPWRLALRLNLGALYYDAGYYSRAITAFELAWRQEGKVPSAATLPLRDAAIGELAKMHARLGHADALEALLAEVGTTPLYGAASEAVGGAREGLWHMRNDPGVAYRCGPAALSSIIEAARRGEGASTPAISAVGDSALQGLRSHPSGVAGVSMDEVLALAVKAGMDLVPAHRQGTADLPLPAVVHWKVSHYAAIVGRRDGLYHVIDPTFGRDQWIGQDALDAESSGIFLIPASALRTVPGWQRVQVSAVKQLYGRGYLTAIDTTDTRADSPKTCPNGAGGDGTGMCTVRVTTLPVSLNLEDRPVGYTPPVGPDMHTQVSYNQRESSQPSAMAFFNIGPQWTLNWLSYVQDNPASAGASVTRYASGGGSLAYGGYASATGTFTREVRGGAQLVLVSASPVRYERRLSDGGIEVFAASNGATSAPRRVFLSQIIDPQGNSVGLEYDSSMRLVRVLDAIGQATTFSYSEAANPLLVSRITDPFGRAAVFTYDSAGRLVGITDAVGITSSVSYDGTGTYITQLTTPYGTTSFATTTASTNRSLQITDPLGNTTRTELNAKVSGLTADTPPAGLGLLSGYQQYRNTFHWDGEAFARAPGAYNQARINHWLHNGSIMPAVLESTRTPLESRVWYLRDGQSSSIHFTGAVREEPNKIARVLPDGTTQLTSLSYNAQGQVTAEIDPIGRQANSTYDSAGVDLLTATRMVSGAAQTLASFTYNSQHRPLTYVDQAGRSGSMSYNARGQLTAATNPLGQTTSYTYDANGYLTQVVNANGQVQASYTYDQVGRVASATDSEGYAQTYTYDALDRLVSTIYPDGTTTVNTWTLLDLTAVKDRLGRVTNYTYNANRVLTAVTDPAGRVTRYGHDRSNRLVSLTDPNGNVTQWERDVAGRVTAKIFPDATRITYSYDTAGRLVQEADVLGQQRNYSYAKDDRPLGVAYTNAVNPTPSVTYSWDPYFPRIAGMVDGLGTTSYSYAATGVDGAGQVVLEQTPQGGIGYAYDALGRISGRSANGADLAVTYDAIGRVDGEGNDLGDFVFQYLGQTNQVVAQTLALGDGNVTQLQYGYLDNQGDRRLKSIAQPRVKSRELSFVTDPEGRLVSSSFSKPLGSLGDIALSELRDYAYDAGDRLTAVNQSLGSTEQSYAYDSAGNLIAQAFSNPTTSWQATANGNNQLATVNDVDWVYDQLGNLLNDGKRSYQWDAQNHLVQIANLQTGSVTEMAYDGLGRRVQLSERASATATAEVTRYLWCGSEPCQKLDADGAIASQYLDQGELQGSTKLMYFADRIGSVREVFGVPASATTEPAILGQLGYSAYGRASTSSGTLPDKRYAAMLYHAPSGLYLTWYRAYDPESGRWLSRDPIGEAGGENLYAYVKSDPISFIDRVGLLRVPSWVRDKYPKTTAHIMSMKERMSDRKYEGFAKFGKIGRRHLDEQLKPCAGPVVNPVPSRKWYGHYSHGGGVLEINAFIFEDYESGRTGAELLDATIEHELVHFSEYFWGQNAYRGEEGEDYEKFVYGKGVE